MTGGVSLDASLGTSGRLSAAREPASPVAGALDACDRLLGEIGRRQHRFAWLPEPGGAGGAGGPGGAGGEWLAVDAYYPGNRIVVVCRGEPEVRALCERLVPAHGLRLVSLDPAEAAAVPAAAAALAGERIERRRPLPPTVAETVAQVPGLVRSPDRERRFGLQVGIALSAVVLAEAYLAAVVIAFGDGQPVLGLGLLLDACARVLGVIAAGHAGEHTGAWIRLIAGSPKIASLRALAGSLAGSDPGSDPGSDADSDAARLAGTVASAALTVTALGLAMLVIGA